MVNKVYYTEKQIDGMTHSIIRQLIADDWKPDYVVGLTRGGLVPALKISHYLGVRMETLKVSLRDGGECETNCWMAEDAFGYVDEEDRKQVGSRWDTMKRKNILIVDDINDTGATLEWIKKDWEGCCLPDEPSWETVWGNNVRFAAMINNDASSFEVNYIGESINKAEEDVWIVFPWEEWWK
jgi:hypoxanthine phosphoribosyltransferase